jgi:hypothetical protein
MAAESRGGGIVWLELQTDQEKQGEKLYITGK